MEIWFCDVYPAFLLQGYLAKMPVKSFRAHADIFDLLFLFASKLTKGFEVGKIFKGYSEEIICLKNS